MVDSAQNQRVSVVIPTFNRRERVARAVRSVLSGTRPPDELIVVDDGSDDGTARSLTALSRSVRVIRHRINRGVSAARNTGVGAASHPWVALLDSDDLWLPTHLDTLLTAQRAQPGIVALQTLERWYRKGLRVNAREKHRPPAGDILTASIHLCLVSSSAVLFRVSAFEAAGGYDERLPACEDYDLWLRMARRHHFGLAEIETIEKDGGRPDQLSRRIWGLDRFRVFALVKLLSHPLQPEVRDTAMAVCLRKLSILGAGARKRGKVGAVAGYERWLGAVERLGGRPVASEPEHDQTRLPPLLLNAGFGQGNRPDPILDSLLSPDSGER